MDMNHKSISYTILSQSILIIPSLLVGIWTILKTKTLWRGKKLNIHITIIFSLFVAHLGIGFILFFRSILFLMKPRNQTFDLLMDIMSFGQFIFSVFEISFTITLSFERFIHVRYPFHYKSHEKLYTALIFLIPLLLIAFTFTLYTTVGLEMAILGPLVMSLVGAAAVLVSNVYLYQIIKKQNIHIASTMVYNSTTQQNEEQNAMRKRQMRSLKICATMTSTYVFLWLPYIIAAFIAKERYNKVSTDIFWTLQFFAHMNAVTDVYIYLLLSNEARQVLKDNFKSITAICSADVRNNTDG